MKMDAGTVLWRAVIGYINKYEEVKPEAPEFEVCIEPHPTARMKREKEERMKVESIQKGFSVSMRPRLRRRR